MSSKTLAAAALAALSCAAGSTALANPGAGEGYDPLPVSTASALTRAQVRSEAAQARAQGLVTHGDRTVFLAPQGQPTARAQVLAELAEALRLGAFGKGEDGFAPTPEQLRRIQMAGLQALDTTLATR